MRNSIISQNYPKCHKCNKHHRGRWIKDFVYECLVCGNIHKRAGKKSLLLPKKKDKNDQDFLHAVIDMIVNIYTRLMTLEI